MKQDLDHLLLLGGSHDPRQRLRYSLSEDSWSQPLSPPLPFDFDGGACMTIQMKGINLIAYNNYLLINMVMFRRLLSLRKS